MIRSSLKAAPAPYLITGLGAVVALVVAFGHLTAAEAAALYSIVAAAGTIYQAAVTRPVGVTVVTGAAGVILGDLVILNIHLSAAEIGAVTAGLGIVLGFVLHVFHVPAATPAPAKAEAQL